MTRTDFSHLIQDEAAKTLFKAYKEAGFELRFVGGCVRDSILGRPLQDFDFATTATPQQGTELLENQQIKVIPTGIAHGTITAHLSGRNFEITTLRQDVATDGRHAKIAYTNEWEKDAARRDFTVNALYVDSTSTLFDYCDGLHDIAQKRLRFIGDAASRIQEDFLRILRYFRFASELDWPIEDKATLAICCKYAESLHSLSRERIQHEIYRLLLGDGALRILKIMQAEKILPVLFGFNSSFDSLERLMEQENKYEDPDAFRRLWSCSDPKESDWLEKIIALTTAQKKRLFHYKKIAEHSEWKLHKKLYYFGNIAVKDWAFLTGVFEALPVIYKWEKPLFPVKAETLQQQRNLAGKELGDTLKRIEEYWVDNEFRPELPELLLIA